jgi:hypothetical protein
MAQRYCAADGHRCLQVSGEHVIAPMRETPEFPREEPVVRLPLWHAAALRGAGQRSGVCWSELLVKIRLCGAAVTGVIES